MLKPYLKRLKKRKKNQWFWERRGSPKEETWSYELILYFKTFILARPCIPC